MIRSVNIRKVATWWWITVHSVDLDNLWETVGV